MSRQISMTLDHKDFLNYLLEGFTTLKNDTGRSYRGYLKDELNMLKTMDEDALYDYVCDMGCMFSSAIWYMNMPNRGKVIDLLKGGSLIGETSNRGESKHSEKPGESSIGTSKAIRQAISKDEYDRLPVSQTGNSVAEGSEFIPWDDIFSA